MKTQQGISLVEVMVAVGLGALILTMIANETLRIQNFISTVGVMGDLRDLSLQIESSIRDPETCNCQINSLTNPTAGPRLIVDTTATVAQSIDLVEWRGKCDFADPDSILAKSGRPIGVTNAATKVQSVKLENIFSVSPGSDLYRGTLTVRFEGNSLTMSRRPLENPLFFEVDLTNGSANSRPAKRCAFYDPRPPKWCPPGWTMYGLPGLAGGFCMQRITNASESYSTAVTACTNLGLAGFSRATVCSQYQLLVACSERKDTSVGTESEMINQFSASGNAIVMRSNCREAFYSPTSRYRCCLN